MSAWDLYKLLAQILGGENLEAHILQVNQLHAWPELLRLSSYQMVSTQLYWSLYGKDLVWQQVDTEAKAYLEEIFLLNQQRNTELKNEAKALISALNDAGICPMLLKGTGLLFSAHCPDIGYRMQLDIDLLCRKGDLAQAANIVQLMGYAYAEETKDGLQPAAPERMRRLTSIYKYHQHLPPLLNPEKRVLLELHQHAYSKRFQTRFPLSGIFDRALEHNQDNLHWYEMSAQDQAALLSVQGYQGEAMKAALQMPLRLGRDYLDLIDYRLKGKHANPDSAVSPFMPRLIEAIYRPDHFQKSSQLQSELTPYPELSHYLGKMQRAMENPRLGRLAQIKANLIRRSISLAHNPWLIWRKF